MSDIDDMTDRRNRKALNVGPNAGDGQLARRVRAALAEGSIVWATFSCEQCGLVLEERIRSVTLEHWEGVTRHWRAAVWAHLEEHERNPDAPKVGG